MASWREMHLSIHSQVEISLLLRKNSVTIAYKQEILEVINDEHDTPDLEHLI